MDLSQVIVIEGFEVSTDSDRAWYFWDYHHSSTPWSWLSYFVFFITPNAFFSESQDASRYYSKGIFHYSQPSGNLTWSGPGGWSLRLAIIQSHFWLHVAEPINHSNHRNLTRSAMCILLATIQDIQYDHSTEYYNSWWQHSTITTPFDSINHHQMSIAAM